MPDAVGDGIRDGPAESRAIAAPQREPRAVVVSLCRPDHQACRIGDGTLLSQRVFGRNNSDECRRRRSCCSPSRRPPRGAKGIRLGGRAPRPHAAAPRCSIRDAGYRAPVLLLGELQQLAGDAGTARSRIDIHAPQLHRLTFGTFQTKGSDDQVAAVRHPETAFLSAVIDFDPIDLLGQRTRDVGLEKRREGPAPTAG